jgi:L-alanine-DL-glutamate epimerase-like enolase superfamily enzyme
LLAKERGGSACELAWGTSPSPVKTFCTIGLSSMEELAEKVTELRDFPRIKIKSDRAADLAPVRYVVAHGSAEVAVDANASWAQAELPALAAQLAALGVAFLEQPLDPREDARLRPSSFPLPVVADESCVTEEDVERAAAHFDGFNVKLVKCGGLTPARRMIRRGRALGKRVMVGCMLESSLLIAAGLVAAQQTDYADLDGAWLLADDPFSGLRFERGVLLPSVAPGFGVAPAVDLFA